MTLLLTKKKITANLLRCSGAFCQFDLDIINVIEAEIFLKRTTYSILISYKDHKETRLNFLNIFPVLTLLTTDDIGTYSTELNIFRSLHETNYLTGLCKSHIIATIDNKK